jgi:hypothetical protein
MALVIAAILLYVLISVFGGISAAKNRWKILVLVVVTVVLEQLVGSLAESLLTRVGIALAISLALAAVLTLWLKVSRIAALKVVALFFAIRTALGILILWLVGAV